jgi:molybdopterin-guanine dinucleotide biosynthesis protein A
MNPPTDIARAPLGAILAGGASRRFGSPKALAAVGGVPIAARVADALRGAGCHVVLIAGDAAAFAHLGLPARGDAIPGIGALGGVHAAVRWAADEGRPGALCIACDMPFIPAPLLGRILALAEETGADAVMPESIGPRGVEPLCAFYAAAAADRIASLIQSGERRVHALASHLTTVTLPLDEVRAFGDPAALFINVNTPQDHAAAERLMATSATIAPALHA